MSADDAADEVPPVVEVGMMSDGVGRSDAHSFHNNYVCCVLKFGREIGTATPGIEEVLFNDHIVSLRHRGSE